MFLSRLLAENNFRAATPENPRFNLNDPEAWDALGASPSKTGQVVSPEKALTWAAWWRGVTLLAKYTAKCPLHVYKTDPTGDFGSTLDLKHVAYKLLRWKPNEYMTAFQFRLAITGHAVNRGNGYAYIWRSGPDPIELSILDPDTTEPFLIDKRLWYKVRVGTDERKVPSEDILHIRGFGFDGLKGYPVWQMAKQCIALGQASESFKAIRFKNQARPGVVLESAGRIDDKAKTRLRDDWERMHTGIDNAHRTAILDNGLKASKMTFTAEEMQEVELAGLSLRDSANFLGIPSSKLGDVAGVKYASKEQDDRNFIDDGLDFWLCAWESEGRDKMLSEAEKDESTRIVAFDRESLIQSDITAQANYFRTATGGRPWMSPAEVRERMRMEPREEPDIDTILTPLNMGQGGANNKPQNPNDTQPGRPAPDNTAPPAPADTNAVRAAAVNALTDTARRMVRRVGHHATRAAKESGKYIAWLESFEAEHCDVIRLAFDPVKQMLIAMGNDDAKPEHAMLGMLRADFNSVADTASDKQLPTAVEAMMTDQITRIPEELAKLYFGVQVVPPTPMVINLTLPAVNVAAPAPVVVPSPVVHVSVPKQEAPIVNVSVAAPELPKPGKRKATKLKDGTWEIEG